MSGRFESTLRGLYRDRENGIFLGVCAGIGEYFDLRVKVLRIITVIALLLFFWPVAIIYLIAGLLLRDRPLQYRGRTREEQFWRRGGQGCDYPH